MALAASTAALLAGMLFAFVATALGHRLLRLCSLEFPDSAEHLLCSTALGLICTEFLLFLSQLSGNIRAGVVVVIAAVVLLAARDFVAVSRAFSQLLSSGSNGSRLEKTLASLMGLVLLVQGLAAMAPLTGSDALHYHFAAPLLILNSGFHPNFFLSHSFFLRPISSFDSDGAGAWEQPVCDGPYVPGRIARGSRLRMPDAPLGQRRGEMNGGACFSAHPGSVLADFSGGRAGFMDGFFCRDGRAGDFTRE